MSEIIKNLEWRYATKQFDPGKKLSQEQLNTLLESLRLSASSFGLQPWKFVVVQNQELKKELRSHSWNQSQVEDASDVIVLCGEKKIDDEFVDRFAASIVEQRGVEPASIEGYVGMMKGFLARMSDEQKWAWVRDQVYIALGSLMVVCAVEGIDACPMEGFSAPDYDRILGLSEKGLGSVVVCPVGFRSSEDKYAQLAKVRYSLEQTCEFYR